MISATQREVRKVLGDEYVHEIPPYQRPYSWRDTEALQLLEDVVEAMDDNDKTQYFLGSIVLIKPEGQKNSQVIDGQQRLTTLTILTAVLRDIASDTQEQSALGEAVYIEPNEFKQQTEAVRLIAHIEDRVFFRETIQVPNFAEHRSEPSPITEAQKHMWTNYCAFKDVIASYSSEKRRRLVSFLLNQCVLVVVSTETRAAALRIFTVLNARGMPLSNADIVKAELLSKFKDNDEMTSEASRWRQVENDLGRDEFEDLLEYLRFIRERSKNRRTLADAYSEYMEKLTIDEVRAFTRTQLSTAKDWYSRIIDQDVTLFETNSKSEATEALAGLALVPNKDWIPAALAAALKFGASALLAKSLSSLESIAWSMQLSRKYDTERMNRYAEFIKALDGDAILAIASLKPSEAEAKNAFDVLNGELYGQFPTRVVRALLERLDLLIAEQPVLWSGIKSVEHILPQTPDEVHWGSYPILERASATHSLGNLVLLTSRKNSSASNSAFSKKKEVYFGLQTNKVGTKRATYASVQELATVTEWTPDEFKCRHTRQVGLLATKWEISQSPKE